jgi:hypothetical protein
LVKTIFLEVYLSAPLRSGESALTPCVHDFIATGVINFLNFTFSALLGAVFGARLVQMPEGDVGLALAHYQPGFKPLLYGIIVALILTFFLKETEPGSRKN